MGKHSGLYSSRPIFASVLLPTIQEQISEKSPEVVRTLIHFPKWLRWHLWSTLTMTWILQWPLCWLQKPKANKQRCTICKFSKWPRLLFYFAAYPECIKEIRQRFHSLACQANPCTLCWEVRRVTRQAPVAVRASEQQGFEHVSVLKRCCQTRCGNGQISPWLSFSFHRFTSRPDRSVTTGTE